MRFSLICLFVLLLAIPARAQEVAKNKTVQYMGIVEAGIGAAYNLNTAQTVSSVNMQPLWLVSTSHGVTYNGWFGGLGMGYNHSQRDAENMYLTFADVRYKFERYKLQPAIGMKGGIIWDPYWIEKVQPYGALLANLCVYDRIRVGVEGSVFSRPSRHFTANAAVVVSYEF